MGRAPCCDKANVKKGPWSPEEDAKLKAYIEQFGTGGNWIALPPKIGLKRCGKSCRLRWLNYLRPNIKHGGFSEEEDNIICSLYINIGSRWSIIAAQLPGRTDNDIKNYWNTRLKKKLLGKQQRERRIHTQKQEITTENKNDGHENFNIINHQQAPNFPNPNTSGQDFRDLIMNPSFQMIQVENPTQTHQNNPLFYESSNLGQFSADMQFGVSNNLEDPTIGMFNEFGDQLHNYENGFEGFYGMGSSSAESSSLGEMSSLVYPQLVSNSNFEACHNSNNVAVFAESRHSCLI